MSVLRPKSALPTWMHGIPPASLTDEWNGIYQELLRPVSTVRNIVPDRVIRGTLELLEAYHKTLRTSEESAQTTLRFLHGQHQKTWRAGTRILLAAGQITGHLFSAVDYIKNPHSYKASPEATANSLRKIVADKITEFPADELYDELAIAVVADCAAQRGASANSATVASSEQDTEVRQLNSTEKKILAHCRQKAHKSERIAHHLGLSWDHTRRVLARLRRENYLRVTDDGYRTVRRAT